MASKLDLSMHQAEQDSLVIKVRQEVREVDVVNQHMIVSPLTIMTAKSICGIYIDKMSKRNFR